MKNSVFFFTVLLMAFMISGCATVQRTVATESVALAQAGSSCPSDKILPFAGQWDGKGLLVPAQGNQQQTQTKDEFKVLDCQRFEIVVNYLNESGAIVRSVDLIASPDSTGEIGLFSIEGTAKEGTSVNSMTGSFKSIQDGTLLGTFTAALGGKVAYFTELMNLTTSPTGETKIVRSVQIFSDKRGGPYVGTRVTIESKPLSAP